MIQRDCELLIMINHGFYNLSPCFYSDFYNENGFKIISSRLVTDVVKQDEDGTAQRVNLPIKLNLKSPDMRFKLVDIEKQTGIEGISKQEYVIETVATKMLKKNRMNFPVQGRYKSTDTWQ